MREGYPEQAGTLAASVFELAHTALFLELDADKATEWLGAGSIEDQMPREVLGTNWREVVRLNTRDSGDVTVAEREYQVYISLCWMKHSLPKMQDMRVESDGKVGLIFGPYSDERSIC
jgi:cytochrome c1